MAKTLDNLTVTDRHSKGLDSQGRQIWGSTPNTGGGGTGGGGTGGGGSFAIEGYNFPSGISEGGELILYGDVFGSTGPTVVYASAPSPILYPAGTSIGLLDPQLYGTLPHSSSELPKTVEADVAPYSGRVTYPTFGGDITTLLPADDTVRSALNIPDNEQWHGMTPFREFYIFSVQRDKTSWPYISTPLPDVNTPSVTKDVWVMYGHRGDNPTAFDGHGHDATFGASFNHVYAVFGNNMGTVAYMSGDAAANFSGLKHNHQSMALSLSGDVTQPYDTNCYNNAPVAVWTHSSEDNTTNITDWSTTKNFMIQNSYGAGSLVPNWFDRIKWGAWYKAGDTNRMISYIYHSISHPTLGTKGLCRIEIFNNAVYANATKRMVCPITTWSNTEIHATTWLGGIDPVGEDVYAVVFDANNNMTAPFLVN